jgi:hypothetical protein
LGSLGALLFQAPANAMTVTGTVQYFAEPENGNHDFGNSIFCSPCGLHYSNEVTGTLGPNGRPVLNQLYSGPSITDLTTGNQLNWWNPTLLTSTGSFTTTTSGSFDRHFFTNGHDDSQGFQTAILTTNNLLANTTYKITYSGDDDVFLAVNGNVFSQDGGVHAIGQLNTATFNTGAADNPLEIFFADRYDVESELQFTISAVPEPSTWAMMIIGFFSVGFLAYRRKETLRLA